MPYILAAKGLIVLIFVSSLVWFIYHKGVMSERNKWELVTQKQAIETAKVLQTKTMEAMQQTEASAQLAQQIEVQAYEHQTEIERLNSELVNAKSSGLQQRTVCKQRSSNAVAKVNSPGIVVDEAANVSELSDEFEKFLISDALRADTVGLYADSAYQWIQELCKQENVICKP